MRLEATRAVAAWLQGDTYGYAPKLAGLSTDGADSLPTTVADASVVTEFDNQNAAFNRFDGMTLPAIIVSCVSVEHRDAELPQLNAFADATVTIQVRYAERTLEPHTALVNGCYAIRAVIASLRELHLNDNAASRTRNSVRLVTCESIEEQGQYEQVEDTWLTAAVQLRYHARNLLPMGA